MKKTPHLQYECDVFSCHGRGNPAPSNFRLDAHAHKLGRILLHEFAVPFRPLVAGGIVRHENNVAVLIHLFLPPSVPLSPGIVACFGGTSPSLSHGLSLFKRTFTLWSNVFSTEEDSSSDFGRDELRMTPGFAVRYEKASFRKLSNGADNGTRTRGLNLGKVALYQLSYVRKCFPPWWATSRKYT